MDATCSPLGDVHRWPILCPPRLVFSGQFEPAVPGHLLGAEDGAPMGLTDAHPVLKALSSHRPGFESYQHLLAV